MATLFDAVRDWSSAHADRTGMAATPIAGLTVICASEPGELVHAVFRPLVCLVLQGAKSVTTGAETLEFNAGDSLIVTADVPVVSQITRASPDRPYLSLVVELDSATIAELTGAMPDPPATDDSRIRVDATDAEVADAAQRLMRLLDRPDAIPVLHGQRLRELHYWLLVGRHAAAIRRLGWPDGCAARIGRAVALLRADYARPLPVDRLAAEAGMSPSAFHQHFRAVTSLSPLQFQKQLRLIEARRLMTGEGASSARAAFAVGYESVPQFTREYGRLFGLPPARDAAVARQRVRQAA